MELHEIFSDIHRLTGKFPNLNMDETKELRRLASHLRAEMDNVIWESEYYGKRDEDDE